MELKHIINDQLHLNVKQAYLIYKDNLLGNPSYITFYKRFLKFKKSKNIKGVKIGSVIYFQDSDFMSFVETIT